MESVKITPEKRAKVKVYKATGVWPTDEQVEHALRLRAERGFGYMPQTQLEIILERVVRNDRGDKYPFGECRDCHRHETGCTTLIQYYAKSLHNTKRQRRRANH